MGFVMDIRRLLSALAVFALVGSVQAPAQGPIVTHKSLSPEIALDLAQAALADCRQRGYQVAVAVVDRSGGVQVVLRDRFARPHTPQTASRKPCTAAAFRSTTGKPVAITLPGR